MKKILSILLTGALCLGLCACGAGPANEADAVPPAAADAAALAAPEQNYVSRPLPLPEGVTEPDAVTAAGDSVYLCAGSTLYALDSGGTVTGSVDLAVDEGAVTAMAPAGDGTLWLMTVLQPAGGAQPASAVCRLDPERGQVLASFGLPVTSASADMCADGDDQRLYVSAGAELLALDWDGNELARLAGQVYDLALAADGTVCALDQQPDGACLLTLDLDGRRWERALAFGAQDVGLYSGGQGYGLLAEVDGTLCALDLDTAAFTPLLDLAAANVTMLSAACAMADGSFLLADGYSPVPCLARPDDGSGPETVTLAVFGAGMLTPAVTAFNNSQDEYRVVLRDYTYDEKTGGYLDYYDTAGLARLGLDIASGEGPDILALDAVPVYQYVRDGLLEDLYPYIDADPDLDREALDGTVLAALERDGALYELAPVVQLRTLASAPGALDGMEELSWSALLERFGEAAFAGEGGSGLLEAGVCGDGSPFADWENGVCDFENEEFLALLALAKGGSQPAESAAPSLLVRSVFGGAALAQSAGELGLDGQVPALSGLPGREGSRHLLSPLLDFGILAQSEHKDGAWAFLRTLLTEPDGMWLGRFLAKDAGADAPAPEGLSAEELARLDQAADAAFAAADGVYHRDMYVAAILREEAAPYFAGQTSAEDTAAAIQNRMSLYLSERS